MKEEKEDESYDHDESCRSGNGHALESSARMEPYFSDDAVRSFFSAVIQAVTSLDASLGIWRVYSDESFLGIVLSGGQTRV